MNKLKYMADNLTAFLKRYKKVKDVWTDPKGLDMISDLGVIFGFEINLELTPTKQEPTPTDRTTP